MKAIRQPISRVPGEGVRTAYRLLGSGPLVLLIHGAEADHTMFLALMDALAANFSVVAYDQRDSGGTENGSAPYDLEALAHDAAALIRFLLDTRGGHSVHVYGTSFGGQIAQVVAARHPHLVDRLILGSTWAVGRQLGDVNATAIEQLARLRGRLPDSAHELASLFFSPAFLAARPETVDLFRGSQRTADQAARRARMMQAAPPAIDFTRITSPTLLLAGGADRLIPPAETFDLARLIANAHMQELPDLPHVGAIEDPERVARAIMGFLLPERNSP
jgi:3-oxoadipate enol-lactonase